MKYYKIINHSSHHGKKYHEGLNIVPKPFNQSGNGQPGGGVYFAREDIFSYLKYGTELYEVEPVGEIYENTCVYNQPRAWRAYKVVFKYIGNVWNNIPFLIEQGANLNAGNGLVLRDAAYHGYLDIVKYLVENGADIHIKDDDSLRRASMKCRLDVVEYLKALK